VRERGGQRETSNEASAGLRPRRINKVGLHPHSPPNDLRLRTSIMRAQALLHGIGGGLAPSAPPFRPPRGTHLARPMLPVLPLMRCKTCASTAWSGASTQAASHQGQRVQCVQSRSPLHSRDAVALSHATFMRTAVPEELPRTPAPRLPLCRCETVGAYD
jgi:hypothetical protein